MFTKAQNLLEATMGININDDAAPWTEWILSGKKTIETRNTPSLNPYIGKRVGIVRTGKGKKATLVGYVTVGKPIKYESPEQFNRDYKKHLVAPDSSFYNGGVKYGYPMIDVEKVEEKPVDSRGIVARRIEGMSKSAFLMNILEELEPTKEEHFQQRTNLHIRLVSKYLDKIIQLKDPRLDPSVLVAEKGGHDQSKFRSPEYEPYLHVNWKYYMKDKGQTYNPPPEIKKAMDTATLHHVTSNKHHPEAWAPTASINSEDRDKPPEEIVDASKMPLSYVATMVADWLAMSEEKSTCPYEWAKKNIGIRWSFTDNQKRLIYDLLDRVWKN